MIRHFLKLTFRNLLKNKTYVTINIIGMGLSLACCIVAYLNYDFGASFDRNHEHIDKIYKIHVNKKVQEDLSPFGITPQALAPFLANESTAIQKISRYNWGELIVQKGDNVLEKDFGFVDDDYLDMFTYPLKYGTKESLLEIGHVILSDEMSKLYFKEENPVGQMIKLRTPDQPDRSFTVSGVFEPIPENTSMKFDGLMHYDNYLSLYKVENIDWTKFVAATFIWVDDPSVLPQINQQLEKYIPIQNEARTDWMIHNFEFIPLTKLGTVGQDVRSNWLNQSLHPAAKVVPAIMALLMLLIACFNFTNTSISISSKRLKEIGLRKVMGSNKKQLIVQFMGENIVLCMISLVLAISVAIWMVPAYGALWEGMPLEFNLSKDIGLILFLVALLIFTAVIAGAYPSVYISSYEPVGILKGNFQIGSSKKFTTSLLVLQFTITVMALIASVAFTRNANYQQAMDLGFEKETIVYTQVKEPKEAVLLKNVLIKNPKIESVGISSHHIGRWIYSRTLSQQEFELEADLMDFGEGYIETMDLELIAGRKFDEANQAYDIENSILVNETLVKAFGWDQPLGQKVSLNDTTRLTVVGVLKDFYSNGFWDKIAPMAIRSSNNDHLNFVVARTNASDVKEVFDLMESTMLSIAPNKPFEGRYQEDLLKESLTVNKNIVIMFTFLGSLAMILSTIGLFTLVSLNIHKRTKEIGIRKVLGASIVTIITLLNRNYLIMILVSAVLGASAAYFAIDGLIASIFSYYKQVDLITLLIPGLLILGVSIAVSAGRIFQSARKNPVESLRYE